VRIAIVGANGQLGNDLVKVLRPLHDLTPLTRADVQVTSPESVEAMLRTHQPELVMNMAAFHKVDVCEDEVEPAFAVNAYGVRTLAWPAGLTRLCCCI